MFGSWISHFDAKTNMFSISNHFISFPLRLSTDRARMNVVDALWDRCAQCSAIDVQRSSFGNITLQNFQMQLFT